VLRIADVADDVVTTAEVRIECAAVGLNFLDLMRCRGTYPLPPTFPLTFGVEVAGRVVETGATARHWLGRDVIACPTLPRGALAERVVTDARFVTARPADIDVLVAAALPVNYQTAWFGLERSLVRAGSSVLVTAAAGGVGLAAIQLAVARGARVIAAAGGPEKVAACRRQGADVAIDYLAEDLPLAVLDATGGAGVDVVLDQVGGVAFGSLLEVVAVGGVIVAIGTAAGPIVPVDPMELAARNIGVIGLSWGSTYPQREPPAVADCYRKLFELQRAGHVRPVIADVVPLAAAPTALARLGARRTIGKLLVTPGR
jgi:NADPH:quinone reductase